MCDNKRNSVRPRSLSSKIDSTMCDFNSSDKVVVKKTKIPIYDLTLLCDDSNDCAITSSWTGTDSPHRANQPRTSVTIKSETPTTLVVDDVVEVIDSDDDNEKPNIVGIVDMLQTPKVEPKVEVKEEKRKTIADYAGIFDLSANDSTEIDATDEKLPLTPSLLNSSQLTDFEAEMARKYSQKAAIPSPVIIPSSCRYHFTTKVKDDIHTLTKRPTEDQLDDAPDFLNVTMMRHQLHALKFMRWREAQKMKGGILADDMGLGKTLTTIALILKQLQIQRSQEFDSKSSDWISKGRTIDGGTLVVCPASLVRQWEDEIGEMVAFKQLSCHVYHGSDKVSSAIGLSQYDVVITTYHAVNYQWSDEPRKRGILYQLKFKRIVLDEGHIIRNPDTKFAKSVWDLEADARWVLSGTPIQNKELDLFAVVKFLRCEPFDDIGYWNVHVPKPSKEDKKYEPSKELQDLLNLILLRRTKAELEAAGHISPLPKKELIEVRFELDEEERFIYNRLMSHSKKMFENFMAQQRQKHGETFIIDEPDVEGSFSSSVNYTGIFVLLLRLRQSTCHMSLIKKEVERWQLEPAMNEDENNSNIANITSSNDIFQGVESAVFSTDRLSSKMKKLMEHLDGVIKEKNKVIIVSQWVTHLEIIKQMLNREGIKSVMFTGQCNVSDRNEIVKNFNESNSKTQVMLLSLACGGVGLNLVGANVMFIVDLHWNPQLEKQGQDRIYRFGQKKDVKIFKFICDDTIEERVVELHKCKLQIADSLLTGSTMNSGSALTFNDLRNLFGVGRPANAKRQHLMIE